MRAPQTRSPAFAGLGVLAGELGFEPRLAVSETAVLPLDDSPIRDSLQALGPGRLTILALGELRSAASLVQADLLALDFACVTGHEARLAQFRLQRVVVLDKTTGDAEADGAGLAGDAATFNRDRDVELIGRLGQHERLAGDHARRFATEEFVERTTVDSDLAFTLAQEHAGGGGLATAGAVIVLRSHGFLPVP